LYGINLKIYIMKKLLKMLLIAIVISISSCNKDSDELLKDDPAVIEQELLEGDFGAKEFEKLENLEDNKNNKSYFSFSLSDIENPILDQITGRSLLIRGRRGIFARYRSNNLIPGHVYTLWWVIWNNPENCAIPGECNDPDFATPGEVGVDVLFAGSGLVVGANGKGTFYALLRAGDDSESINDLFELPPAGGLQKGNTFSSEVHMVLRSHGPAIPGMIDEQMNSYIGGCTDPFAIAPFTEIPDESGECGDIEFSIHAPN
jgi:hypothetical protein